VIGGLMGAGRAEASVEQWLAASKSGEVGERSDKLETGSERGLDGVSVA